MTRLIAYYPLFKHETLFCSELFIIIKNTLFLLKLYVALSDPGSMKFCHIIEQSPCDWESTVCQNVALTVFHTQNISHHAWKTLRITLWCFAVLQSRGKGLKSKENYGRDFSPSVSPFHDILPRLETKAALQCSSDIFPRMLIYIFCVENCQNYILTHSCLPLQGDCSIMWENFMDPEFESAIIIWNVYFILENPTYGRQRITRQMQLVALSRRNF